MVAQYETKFIELSHFALDPLATDSIKIQRFDKGLKLKIHQSEIDAVDLLAGDSQYNQIVEQKIGNI